MRFLIDFFPIALFVIGSAIGPRILRKLREANAAKAPEVPNGALDSTAP